MYFEGLEDKELAMRPIASGGLAPEVLQSVLKYDAPLNRISGF